MAVNFKNFTNYFGNDIHTAISLLVGYLAIIFSLFEHVISKFIPIEKFDLGILLLFAIMGLILVGLGEEMKKSKKNQDQVKNIEIKFDQSFESLKLLIDSYGNLFKELKNHISAYELIHGLDNITLKAKEGIETAKREIRATSFICADQDVGEAYFKELAKKIKSGTVSYYCCFDSKYDFTMRKKIFQELNFVQADYKKMHYYKFNLLASFHFDFILIDDQIAFIAFPNIKDEKEMNLMIKVEANSKQNKELIKGLIAWYESLQKIQIEDTQEFYDTWTIKQIYKDKRL
jgi:hypothetical protein